MGGQTTFTPNGDLAVNQQHFWRVRASDGEATSSWAQTQTFRTPLAPTPGPGPGPGPGNGGSCASNNGDQIVRCVAAKYPERLAAGVSLDQRIGNMEFLRDRVIEAGICGGLDLAWNQKRGVGPRSIDAIAWRHDGIDDVVDVGAAYDDTSRPLGLQWGIVARPSRVRAVSAAELQLSDARDVEKPDARERIGLLSFRGSTGCSRCSGQVFQSQKRSRRPAPNWKPPTVSDSVVPSSVTEPMV